jgi:hypothetical protein
LIQASHTVISAPDPGNSNNFKSIPVARSAAAPLPALPERARPRRARGSLRRQGTRQPSMDAQYDLGDDHRLVGTLCPDMK